MRFYSCDGGLAFYSRGGGWWDRCSGQCIHASLAAAAAAAAAATAAAAAAVVAVAAAAPAAVAAIAAFAAAAAVAVLLLLLLLPRSPSPSPACVMLHVPCCMPCGMPGRFPHSDPLVQSSHAGERSLARDAQDAILCQACALCSSTSALTCTSNPVTENSTRESSPSSLDKCSRELTMEAARPSSSQ